MGEFYQFWSGFICKLASFPLELFFYLNFIQFRCWICRNFRTFHGVKFSLKDLLCVKDMTFCNSDVLGREKLNPANQPMYWEGGNGNQGIWGDYGFNISKEEFGQHSNIFGDIKSECFFVPLLDLCSECVQPLFLVNVLLLD